MPEHLRPPEAPAASTAPAALAAPATQDEDGGAPRIPSRSPHPYHRQGFELLEPSGRFASRASIAGPFPPFARESPPASESGTEADDEHFLKGLPAPRARLHKGLRGRSEPPSGTSTPLLSPAVLEEEGRQKHASAERAAPERGLTKRAVLARGRRRKELIRRTTEVLLIACQGGMVASSPAVQPFLRLYQQELLALGALFCSLAAAYPLRLTLWAYRRGAPSKAIPIRIPNAFDPAPFLYPPLVPVFVSLLVAENARTVVLPTLVLSICALPRPLVPGARHWEYLSSSHWLLSCLPFVLDNFMAPARLSVEGEIPQEVLVLLYPLHQTLCLILHHLTTTSLLVSELQLLSVGLIGLFLSARSPQAVILKALLWGGGLGLIVLCGQVIQWGISLARVPKWRFRRAPSSTKSRISLRLLRHLSLSPFRSTRSDAKTGYGSPFSDSEYSTEEYLGGTIHATFSVSPPNDIVEGGGSDTEVSVTGQAHAPDTRLNNNAEPVQQIPARRHTLPSADKPAGRSKKTTPSGRRKRAASSSIRPFFALTQTQATIRKWLYAGYVYLCIMLVIFGGIRSYVQHYALSGKEPIGWALGYLFGDLAWFRFQTIKANLERWICLPPRLDPEGESRPACPSCHSGWVDHVRRASLGEANTRLALAAYWLAILAGGLALVLRLSPVCEVDTRRKVFHFMMVAILLPATYVDPAFAALALALALAVFLLLDLLRASQLPPLSRPLARFLAPYVDGRDLRGPVVVSHMFLLVGCAIPLWLSLASLPRSGAETAPAPPPSDGWELPSREVSMVAGVVCVGLGDAAASLVGRRWGRRKWLWGGGKSVEGSAAFAAAVFAGLMAAAAWLRVGGWPVAGSAESGPAASGMESLMGVLDPGRLWAWSKTQAPPTAACASLASLTEAVLTGGNDNVIVPVVLWGCVKSLGV